MKYRLLGNTGLYVSELCLGTMTFGSAGGFWDVMGSLQQDAVTAQVKRAFDAGINFIDTANVYSFGQSETLVGQAIKDLGLPRDELVVATKATGPMSQLPNGRGQSRYHLMHQVDASLQRLQLDHIDLYQLHAFDPLTPLEESLSTLNDLVRSGKVRTIGLCNMAAWQIMKALAISERHGWARFESVQAYYTIAGRDLERDVVPLLEDQKLGLMVWSPLAGGLLTGKFGPDGKGPEGTRRATFDFPLVDKDARLPLRGRHAADRRAARCFGRAGRARVAARPAVGDDRHHRRAFNGAAGRQSCVLQARVERRGRAGARRRQPAAEGVPGLDARHAAHLPEHAAGLELKRPRSIGAARPDGHQRPGLVELARELDRLTADLAVFDVGEPSGRKIDGRLEPLAAIRTVDGHEPGGAGRIGPPGLEHRLEPIDLVDGPPVERRVRARVGAPAHYSLEMDLSTSWSNTSTRVLL